MEKIKVRTNDAVYMATDYLLAYPVNRNGQSINIHSSVTISPESDLTAQAYWVYLGTDPQKNIIYDGKSYLDCENWVKEYLKDTPVYKKIDDWFDELHPDHIWPARWFRLAPFCSIKGWHTREEAVELIKKQTIVSHDDFFTDPEKYKPLNK